MKFRLLFLVLIGSSAIAADEFKIPSGEETPKASFKKFDVSDGYDWGVKQLNVPELHKKGITGKGVKVAVLDTGVDASHPDLKSNVKGGKDYTGSRFGWSDRNSHGTHCAGTIAANGDLKGVAPDCEIYALKVLGDNGSGQMAWTAKAIYDAVDEFKVDVISMSLGASQGDAETRKAVQYAVSKGVIVVAAAGNDGPSANTVGAPGGYPETVCVGACDANDKLAAFSSRGPRIGNPFIVAPGVDITSTIPGGRYGAYDGTSMATPHVAGCAALWVEVKGKSFAADKREGEFKKALIAAANFKERDSVRGYGLFDAVKLVGGIPTDRPQVPPPGSTFTITDEDLSESARKKLGGAKFTLTLTVPSGTQSKGTAPVDSHDVAKVGVWDYQAARSAVVSGQSVILTVGTGERQVGEYSVSELPGIAPGRYRCHLVDGVPKMELLTLPIAQPVFNPPLFPALYGQPPRCLTGNCPTK